MVGFIIIDLTLSQKSPYIFMEVSNNRDVSESNLLFTGCLEDFRYLGLQKEFQNKNIINKKPGLVKPAIQKKSTPSFDDYLIHSQNSRLGEN